MWDMFKHVIYLFVDANVLCSLVCQTELLFLIPLKQYLRIEMSFFTFWHLFQLSYEVWSRSFFSICCIIDNVLCGARTPYVSSLSCLDTSGYTFPAWRYAPFPPFLSLLVLRVCCWYFQYLKTFPPVLYFKLFSHSVPTVSAVHVLNKQIKDIRHH